MATVRKLTVTCWVVPDPDDPKKVRHVSPRTPGAVKRTEKSGVYFIVWKENGRRRTEPTGLTDKRAARKRPADWITARERGGVGLVDPHKAHLDRPALEHLAEYTASLRESTRYDGYPKTVERELKKLLAATNVVALRDLTTERVAAYLAGLGTSAGTRNKVRSYAFSFCRWLMNLDLLTANPVARVKTAKMKVTDATVGRRRRAMKVSELRQLLSAAERYPVEVTAASKGGRPRADGAPARPSQKPPALSPETLLLRRLEGRERRLIYRTAVLTGLRRGELSRVWVGLFRLDAKVPVAELPGHITKNGRAATLVLPPDLAADLRAWVADTNRNADDRLFRVPDGSNMVRMHKRHMAHAGLAYKTDDGFADFHPLRKTTNTFLRRLGVGLRLRQRFLRHAAADLATNAYDDERLREMRPVAAKLAKLDATLRKPVAVEAPAAAAG